MILALLQARMSSSRLPGKVLKPLLGQPMLQRQLERIKQASQLDKVIVATSNQASDDGIAELCQQLEQPCFRGDLNNVLARFYRCAVAEQPSQIVRLTGDCPLIDAKVIDQVIDLHLQGQYDYTTNAYPQTFPDGLDVEVITFDALERVYRQAHLPEHFEHVTLYVRQHPEAFNIGQLRCPEDLSQQRWTVDHPADFSLAEAVYQQLYPQDPAFDYQQVMTLLRRQPDLFQLNQHFVSANQ